MGIEGLNQSKEVEDFVEGGSVYYPNDRGEITDGWIIFTVDEGSVRFSKTSPISGKVEIKVAPKAELHIIQYLNSIGITKIIGKDNKREYGFFETGQEVYMKGDGGNYDGGFYVLSLDGNGMVTVAGFVDGEIKKEVVVESALSTFQSLAKSLAKKNLLANKEGN